MSQCCHVRDIAVYLPALLSRCIIRDSVDPKAAVYGERFFSLDISLDILKGLIFRLETLFVVPGQHLPDGGEPAFGGLLL